MISGTVRGEEEATRGDSTRPTAGTPTTPGANDDLDKYVDELRFENVAERNKYKATHQIHQEL